MNVLSLFDGLSAAKIALDQLGITCDYFSSEIDKWALGVSQYHYQQCRLGDVTKIDFYSLPKIDLLIGGSPCTSLSIAKLNRQGLSGDKSKLFYKYVEALQICKPKYFIFENVASMKKEDQEIISRFLGVEPLMINSALVSCQMRTRFYWCNFKIEQPIDRGILLKDIIENGHVDRDKAYCLDASYYKGKCSVPYHQSYRRSQVYINKNDTRLLTPIECELLQTIPRDFTKYGIINNKQKEISNTQRYKMLGNSFTVEVIKHILRYT